MRQIIAFLLFLCVKFVAYKSPPSPPLPLYVNIIVVSSIDPLNENRPLNSQIPPCILPKNNFRYKFVTFNLIKIIIFFFLWTILKFKNQLLEHPEFSDILKVCLGTVMTSSLKKNQNAHVLQLPKPHQQPHNKWAFIPLPQRAVAGPS